MAAPARGYSSAYRFARGAMLAAGTLAAAGPAAAGGMYDINLLLNEPHPFAQGPAQGLPVAASVPVPLMQSGPAARPWPAPERQTEPMVGFIPPSLAPAVAPPVRQAAQPVPTDQPLPNAAPNRPVQTAETDAGGGMVGSVRNFLRGWYVSLGGGIDFIDDIDGLAANGRSASTSRDFGYMAMAAAGAWGGEFLRGELEYARRVGFYDSVTVGGVDFSVDNEIIIDSLMANLIFEPDTGTITPFAGIGLGAALVNSDDIVAGGTRFNGKDTTEGAVQGIAGIRYRFDQALSVTGEARYFQTTDREVNAVTLGAQMHWGF
jgi:opacity protein-like surface antigen